MNEELSSNLLWVYFLVSIGVALQVGAANWDIIWHGIVNVESFFTPPHSVLYSGVGLSLIATVAGVILSIRHDTPIMRPFSAYQHQMWRTQKTIKSKICVPPVIKLTRKYFYQTS